jgi:Ser/Thr protein kinase RdoA (MazF antagonist)
VSDAIPAIFSQFQTGTQPVSVQRIGSGHIHQTYQITTADPHHPGYILQQFNQFVFPQHQAVMENLLMVTEYLRQNPDYACKYQVAGPVKSTAGQYFVTGQNNTLWRLFHRIAPGISFDQVPDQSVACEAGRIYGSFLAALRDFPVGDLREVIPGFHSVNLRYAQLETAINTDVKGRVALVQQEIQTARQHIDTMRVIPQAQQNGKLPVRVTHNDTKLNNVLFDAHGRAVAVVDLDTVMPGVSLYDFGDLVRTAANTGNEDSANASFSEPMYQAIKHGFLEQAGPYLTSDEMDLLPLAPKYMAYIMAIRFLADYINGDVYYSISRPQHNLDRCRAQFRLLESMGEELPTFLAVGPS